MRHVITGVLLTAVVIGIAAALPRKAGPGCYRSISTISLRC